MSVLIYFLSLCLFHSVSCQIETQEQAIDIACEVIINGLSGNTECALANGRGVLVTNGIEQTLSSADLYQLCGPTACAALTDITPICIRSGENVEDIRYNQMQRNNLVCTGTPDVRSCGEFLATSEFQALNMSFGDTGVCNRTATPVCTQECVTLLSNFINVAGCCAREIIDYKRRVDDIEEPLDSIFARCDIENAPNDCQNLRTLFRAASGATTRSVGTFGAMSLLMLIITATIAI